MFRFAATQRVAWPMIRSWSSSKCLLQYSSIDSSNPRSAGACVLEKSGPTVPRVPPLPSNQLPSQCRPSSTSSKNVPLICDFFGLSRTDSQHAGSPGSIGAHASAAHILLNLCEESRSRSWHFSWLSQSAFGYFGGGGGAGGAGGYGGCGGRGAMGGHRNWFSSGAGSHEPSTWR